MIAEDVDGIEFAEHRYKNRTLKTAGCGTQGRCPGLRRGHANFRSGLMSQARPSECPPTARSRTQLEWLERQSPLRFSFACSLKILGLETGLWVEAIVFSLSPPSDRSRVGEACSGDGEERGRSAKRRNHDGSIHELPAFVLTLGANFNVVQRAKTRIV
jgi:hypothetical protein